MPNRTGKISCGAIDEEAEDDGDQRSQKERHSGDAMQGRWENAMRQSVLYAKVSECT